MILAGGWFRDFPNLSRTGQDSVLIPIVAQA
jgi:hypothetical protein